MDYVKGNITEPPSNAPATAKTKYKKGEVKAKTIIIDSIQKHLVAYISDLGTSKEMYDKLVWDVQSEQCKSNPFSRTS